MKAASSPRKRADSTRELIRAKALVSGQRRSADIRSRVEAAMATIVQEIASNDGIYPHNKGAVSKAEVARRASVHETTLFSPKQRVLGEEVRDWIKALKKRNTIGAVAVKRSIADRIADWKELYNGLAQSHRDTELKLQQTEADLGVAREQLGAMANERDALRAQLAKVGGASVVTLLPKKG